MLDLREHGPGRVIGAVTGNEEDRLQSYIVLYVWAHVFPTDCWCVRGKKKEGNTDKL